MTDDLTNEEQAALLTCADIMRLNDLLYDAIEANVPEDVLPGDATTDALFVMLDNPALVLAALVEAGWRPTDDDLRAMGGNRGAVSTPLFVWLFPRTEEATDE